MSNSFRSAAVAIVAFALLATAAPADAVEPTGSMSIARLLHTASRLPDGRILIAGGSTIVGDMGPSTSSAEIYDPATGSFSPTASMGFARVEHGAATLQDGRVLVVGGHGFRSDLTPASAEIYDPTSGTWTPTGRMFQERPTLPVALTLADGKVLIFGGNLVGLACELFDPATGTFTPVDSPFAARGFRAAVVLQDGRVLAAGGTASGVPAAEIWDPARGWDGAGLMNFNRTGASATLLANGKVLIVGGLRDEPGPAEIFDPATGRFSLTGSTVYPHINHVAAALADGSVIVTGSSGSDPWSASIERYDPASGTWTAVGTMARKGYGHTASLLANGNVLLAGGFAPVPNQAAPYVATAELFIPACASADSTSSISPASLSFPAAGGTTTVAVTYQTGCRWTVDEIPPWITVTPAASGHGNGTVTFTVARNPFNVTLESAGMKIAGREFHVTQQPDLCIGWNPSVSPTSMSVAAGVTIRPLAVSMPFGCPWTVTNVPSWITLPGGTSGAGNATIAISIAANAGAARSAELLFGTTAFTVTQAANACFGAVASLSPTSLSVPWNDTLGFVTLQYRAGCRWTVTGVPEWMDVWSAGTGDWEVRYRAFENTGAARSATLTIAGVPFAIQQAAVNWCEYVTPMEAGVTYSGSLSATDCTKAARGSQYYTDRYFYFAAAGQRLAVELSSQAFDTYLYLRDPNDRVIASDNDSGSGRNSRLPANGGFILVPPSAEGQYVIEVTSRQRRATGGYSVRVIER